jgi:Mg2+-importing ATPase
VFDLLTFGVLVRVFHASVALFRTGWFVESLMTELVIALVVRTRRPFFRSRPGRLLLVSSLGMMMITPVIPWLPGASRLGFVPLPGVVLATLGAIVVAYVGTTELAKVWFYRFTAKGRA